jgi:hypothetical protein
MTSPREPQYPQFNLDDLVGLVDAAGARLGLAPRPQAHHGPHVRALRLSGETARALRKLTVYIDSHSRGGPTLQMEARLRYFDLADSPTVDLLIARRTDRFPWVRIHAEKFITDNSKSGVSISIGLSMLADDSVTVARLASRIDVLLTNAMRLHRAVAYGIEVQHRQRDMGQAAARLMPAPHVLAPDLSRQRDPDEATNRTVKPLRHEYMSRRASAAWDSSNRLWVCAPSGMVVVWEPQSWLRGDPPDHRPSTRVPNGDLIAHPQSGAVAARGVDGLSVWTDPGATPTNFPCWVDSAAWDPTSNRLAAHVRLAAEKDPVLLIWDAPTTSLDAGTATVLDYVEANPDLYLWSLAFGIDGSLVSDGTYVGNSGVLASWTVDPSSESSEPRWMSNYGTHVSTTVATSSNEDTIAVATSHGRLHIRDLAPEPEVSTWHALGDTGITSMAWSGDGHLAVATEEKILVWAPTEACLGLPPRWCAHTPNSEGLRDLAWSQRGDLAVCHLDGSVLVWPATALRG